jgi:hypothetical protein
MPSTKNWWAAEVDWSSPAGRLLQGFLNSLPQHQHLHAEIDVRREIIEPAMLRRKQGYGESPPDYKTSLNE